MYGRGGYRDIDSSQARGDGGRGRNRGFRPRGGGRAGLGFADTRYKKSYSDEAKDQVDELYNKKFKFRCDNQGWTLPDASKLFVDNPTEISRLRELKEKLNEAKGKLNDKDPMSWSSHTRFTDRAGLIVGAIRRDFQPELCTQGWAKFQEMLCSFQVVPEEVTKYNSVHLCEAPGGFVASLNHYLKTHRSDCEWCWNAITLNPYFEGNSMFALTDQDRFVCETWDHWYWGKENSGDVTHWENAVGFQKLATTDQSVHLVTADGVVDLSEDPEDQESLMVQLLLCEVVTALGMLSANGSLVLKTFTIFEHPTVSLLYLLCCCFSEVNVYKPVTSKAVNSELYIVCVGYQTSSLSAKHMERLKQAFGPIGTTKAMLPMSSLPASFISEMIACVEKFARYQMEAIEDNVRLYDCMRKSERQFIQEVRELTWERFRSRFNLKNLSREKAIVTHIHLDGTHLSMLHHPPLDFASLLQKRQNSDSFLARMEERKMAWLPKLATTGEEAPPTIKHPRLSGPADTETISAVLCVLSLFGYPGAKVEEKVDIRAAVALEMEPDDIQWMKSPNRQIKSEELKSLDGLKVTKVTNSMFCHVDVLRMLSSSMENAQVMHTAHRAEHMDIATHVSPGHAITSTDPPYHLNHDALNFAALDLLVGFTGKHDDSQQLMYLDLAGAPSGFSHYIYWRKKQLAKGWGIVRLERPQLGATQVMEELAPWDTFQVLGPHSGVNICDNATIIGLSTGVERYCPTGVGLVIGEVPVMPFGAHPPGYSELCGKQYFLSQMICAYKTLKQGGTFICRVNELLTRFSAGLVYICYLHFSEVTILKPITSSPASPERFLVCKGFLGCKPIITEMLQAVNSHITELQGKKAEPMDVLEILPVQLFFDEQFYRFLTLSNERIAHFMISRTTNMEKYFANPSLLPNEAPLLLRKGTLEILQLVES